MDAKKVIDELMEKGADYCDIRKEKWNRMSLNVKDKEIDKVTKGGEEGALVRVLYENGWGCVGTSDLSQISKTGERALSMAKSGNQYKKEETEMGEVETHKDKVEISMEENPLDVSVEEKISLLKDLEKNVNKDYVDSTDLRYRESLVDKEIYTSEGTEIKTKVPRVVTYLIVTGQDETIQRASEGVGGTGGYEITEKAYDKVDVVTERLENLLEADTPPSGSMPLILDPHLAGVFVHEAFGHAAEGDLVSSGNSCLNGKIGEKVADESVTIKDDPTFDSYGRYFYDDEGTKAKERVLVKNGKLNDFILDRENAWKLDMTPNGGARAEDFRVKPLVRMSNTLIETGDMEFDELVEDIDKGVYAKSSSGGQVSPAEGTFQFNAQEAYLIEDGEVKKPLRDVSFNGFTLDTLKNIVGLTKERETGIGHCGKGQTAPVSHGGPHVKVSEVTVGGRE